MLNVLMYIFTQHLARPCCVFHDFWNSYIIKSNAPNVIKLHILLKHDINDINRCKFNFGFDQSTGYNCDRGQRLRISHNLVHNYLLKFSECTCFNYYPPISVIALQYFFLHLKLNFLWYCWEKKFRIQCGKLHLKLH